MKLPAAFAVPFALVLATGAFGAEVTPATPAATAAPAAPAVARRAAKPSALAVALSGILETEKASMAELKRRLAATRDAAAIESLHREIEQLKLDTEVQLLGVQAAHHRAAGRTAVAEQLEASIRALRAPQRIAEPAARPAPAPASR